MSTTTERVSIDDVYPWEDEYGNTPLARDWDTKENKDYVAELAETMREKGEPMEPPILGRDGGIYRIIAGNTRVQAMRLLKTKTFQALVKDDADMEEAIAFALLTNTKKKYSPIEESRFVQLSMKVGWDDEKIASATGIKVEKISNARQGFKAVGDPIVNEQLTIERAEAINDFSDDQEAIERLTNCPENEWQYLSKHLKSLRSSQEEYEKLLGHCTDLGIEVYERAPKGARLIRTIYCCRKDDLLELDPTESIILMPEPTDDETWLRVAEYSSPAAVSDEEQAQIASMNKVKHAMSLAKRRRAEFIAGRMADASMMKNTIRHFTSVAAEDKYDLSRFKELSGFDDIPAAANAWMVAYLWDRSDNMTQAEITGVYKGGTDASNRDWLKAVAKKFRNLLSALMADGYKPDEFENDLFEKCKSAVANKEDMK